MEKEEFRELIGGFIPTSHLYCSLSNFDWKGKDKLKVIIDEFLSRSRKKGLILISEPGRGKTHLMISIFKKLVEDGKDIGSGVMYLEWCNFVQETLERMKFGVVPENVVSGLMSIDLLLLDDIRPMQGQIWLSMLRKLIEEIYDEQKIVILSANAESFEELVKWWQLEDYWVSRVCSFVDVVYIKGIDWRVKAG